MNNILIDYEKTEVGIISNYWDVRVIEDIAEVKSGLRLPLGTNL